MDYSIRHFIPGRIRLHVAVFCAPSPLAESILSWLKKQDFVTSARINYDCASLVVEFDKEHTKLLEEQLALMNCFSLNELDQLLRELDPTGAAAAVGTARSVHSQPKERWPLVLPTVSLAFTRVISVSGPRTCPRLIAGSRSPLRPTRRYGIDPS